MQAGDNPRCIMKDTGYEMFGGLVELRQTLAYSVVSGLCAAANEKILFDFSFGTSHTGAEILAYSVALSRRLPKDEARIALALPVSFAAEVFNFACVLAGKIPVNLNFTLGRAAATACLEIAKINTTYTFRAAREKMERANPSMPWSRNVVYAEDVLRAVPRSELEEIALDISKGVESFAQKYNIERFADNNREATLVFTSGSEGLPKAAVLTQRNIIANCMQTRESAVFEKGDRLLGNLPVFHSFGMLFEIWYMAICSQPTITLSSPLEIKNNIRAIRELKATVIIGTPTFLRAYLHHALPEDLASLRMAIAGAEKMPEGFDDAWDAKFSGVFREGYGLTEASPVLGVNLPERDMGYFSTGNRKGSVGRPFPGLKLKIVSPETGAEVPCGERGILVVKGPNIFAGYLDNPAATARALSADGWLTTGDLARLDADGFLFIEGRLSRFSKIGGEMVPHSAVENVLNARFCPKSQMPQIAVASRLDDAKGEALVILTTLDITLAQAKDALREEGISNLWQPKHLVKVDTIPMLPSGKLDLKTIYAMARAK